jgi:hypothetical protein
VSGAFGTISLILKIKIPLISEGGRMGNVHRFSRCFLAALAAGVMFISLSNATIPAGYKGLPYPPGSAPHEIPGRINFHDYDYVSPSNGSPEGVTFVQDDKSGSAYSNAGGRDGTIQGIPKDSDNVWPAFYLTGHTGLPGWDTFYAAGVIYPNGAVYPGPDTTTANSDYYIGASHANSMTKFTVHVSKAGKYWISSIWAADAYPIQFHINFMNGAASVSTPNVSLNGAGSWHAWRKYSDFASIQLDSGVQVMQFQNGNVHLNQDFLYIAADSGQFTTEIRQATVNPAASQSLGIAASQGAVRFSLPDAGNTKVSVFDCLGKEIAKVLDRNLAAGKHSLELSEIGLRNGIYFIRMEHGNASVIARFQITR